MELEKNGYDLTTFKKIDIIKGDYKDEKIFFTINKKSNNFEMSYVYYDFMEERWKLIEKHCLKYGIPSKLEGTELLPNSSSTIEYELYVFEDLQEIPLNVLFPNDKLKKIKFDDSDDFKYVVPWINGLTLEIGSNRTYKVLLNGNFLSGFTDDVANFQIGDCNTIAYKNNDLIIHNNGDVSSIVVVKYKP